MQSEAPPRSFTTTFDPVAHWAREDGARCAVIDVAGARAVTYAMLHADAERWCALLRTKGVQFGDRVAILAHNRYDFLPLFVACLRIGAALVPLNWRLAPPELARVVEHAAPRLLLSEARFAMLLDDAQRASSAGVPWLDLDRDVATYLASSDDEGAVYASHAVSADALAMVLYTSGSTGAPKGVMISHAQLHWNARSTVMGWELSSSDIAPITTPFFHTAAWHVFTTPLWSCGGRVVVLSEFDASQFLAQLERFAVTQLFCVPTQLQRLLDAPDFGRVLPALRGFVSGGAPLSGQTAQRFRAAGYPLRDAYGLTECGPNCFVMPAAQVPHKPRAVGWPLPFIQMRVVNAHGEPVRTLEIGELQLRGPQVTTGYYRDAALTAQAFTPDGWFRTGDLVRVDDDGAYEVCGRTREIFISGGENVYPGEVEAALAACSGVKDVAVVAVPDEVWGEVGCALIVPSTRPVGAEEILREARTLLGGYKVPRFVVFLDAIPTLGSGKRDTEALRSLAFRAALGEH